MSADKQDTAPAAAPAPAKSNAMLMIVIAVMGTLLLAGGVGAALMLRGGDHEAETEEGVEASGGEADKTKSDSKKKSSKAKEKKGAPKSPAIYVPLEPPFVVNFPVGPGPRFLQITVEIMTRDAGAAQVIKDNNPLVRNDLLQLFASQAQETVAKPEVREELRNQALNTVRGVVKAEGGKPDQIEAVYFTSFIMQ